MSPKNSARTNSSIKHVRRYLSPFLLFSGVAVLGYAGFQYGAMLIEQRHLQALWRQQQVILRADGQGVTAMRRSTGLTRISIPSIQLSAVMVEGTDGLSLMVGPGHMLGTAEPGEPGNSVITAHRDTFFRNIMRVRPGDPIIIERDSHSFTYTVEGFRFVKASDISVAAPATDNRLTLVTCDPAYHLGAAPQRLVVVSKLATQTPASPSVAVWKQPQSLVQAKQEMAKAAAKQ